MFDLLKDNAGFMLNWIVPVAVGAWLVYERKKNGGYNLRKEIVEDYKERNTQLESQITGLKDQVHEQTENFRVQLQKQSDEFKQQIHNTSLQVAELKGLLVGKGKQIESLTAILQGRNPEITQLLVEIKALNKQLIEFLTTANKKTSEILDYQTEMLERGQTRNDGVDKSSKDHTGDPMRVESK